MQSVGKIRDAIVCFISPHGAFCRWEMMLLHTQMSVGMLTHAQFLETDLNADAVRTLHDKSKQDKTLTHHDENRKITCSGSRVCSGCAVPPQAGPAPCRVSVCTSLPEHTASYSRSEAAPPSP